VKIQYYLQFFVASIRYFFQGVPEKSKKKVVYTALINNYDKLHEPEKVTKNWDYIYFSDNPQLSSKVWKIVHIEKNLNNPFLQNRQYKILYHKHLQDYELSIYIDANIIIKGNLNIFLTMHLKRNDTMALPYHYERNCIYKEAE
jgi:hypothetical protein